MRLKDSYALLPKKTRWFRSNLFLIRFLGGGDMIGGNLDRVACVRTSSARVRIFELIIINLIAQFNGFSKLSLIKNDED